jgi:hypothetical protein
MEAVGQLTGGIAHGFNNLLVITGNLELLESCPEHERAGLLKEAQDAAALGSKLTDELLTFSRQRRFDPQVVQLNELVIARPGKGSPSGASASAASSTRVKGCAGDASRKFLRLSLIWRAERLDADAADRVRLRRLIDLRRPLRLASLQKAAPIGAV